MTPAARTTLQDLRRANLPDRPAVAGHWATLLTERSGALASPRWAQHWGFTWLKTRHDVQTAVDLLTRYARAFGVTSSNTRQEPS